MIGIHETRTSKRTSASVARPTRWPACALQHVAQRDDPRMESDDGRATRSAKPDGLRVVKSHSRHVVDDARGLDHLDGASGEHAAHAERAEVAVDVVEPVDVDRPALDDGSQHPLDRIGARMDARRGAEHPADALPADVRELVAQQRHAARLVVHSDLDATVRVACAKDRARHRGTAPITTLSMSQRVKGKRCRRRSHTSDASTATPTPWSYRVCQTFHTMHAVPS